MTLNMQVTPKNAVPTKLYYLGGFVEFVKNQDGETVPNRPIVTAYGSGYIVPKKGEYLTVPKYVAKRLMERNRTPQGNSVFTTNAEFAKQVINANKAEMVAKPIMELTREELEARLAELNGEAEVPVKRNSKKDEVKE